MVVPAPHMPGASLTGLELQSSSACVVICRSMSALLPSFTQCHCLALVQSSFLSACCLCCVALTA